MNHSTRTAKSPIDIFGRNESGQVSKSCANLNHDVFSDGKTFSYVKLSSKKVKQSIINCLKDKGLFLHRRVYLCSACIQYIDENWICQQGPSVSKKLMLEDEKEDNNYDHDDGRSFHSNDIEHQETNSNTYDRSTTKQLNPDELLDLVIKAIDSNMFKDEQLCSIAASLGKSQKNKIFADGLYFAQDYKNLNFQKQFLAQKWLSDRNKVLLAFLSGVSEGIRNSKKETALVRAVEHVYYLRNLNLISPFSFGLNLLQYFVTGSKSAVTLNGASSPSGGYTALLGVLNELGDKTLKCPEGDVDTFFDNCQVVGKNHRVHLQATTPVSVITSVVHIQHHNSDVQQNVDLSPEYWKWSDTVEANHCVQFENTYIDHFRKLRTDFIKILIDEVTKEQTQTDGGNYIDPVDIDDEPSKPKNSRTYIAQVENNEIFLTENCHSTQNSFPEVSGNHPHGLPTIKIGEPLLENPNSFQSVEKVLEHLTNVASVPLKRKWCSVGCDGLPYLLACKIIENTFVCPACNTSLRSGSDDFISHIEEHGMEINSVHSFRKFKNILLRPGLGHFEMNMVKCVFKMLWIVLLSFVSKLLGFRSERAQQFCQAATDHHKSWDIVQIVFEAISRELLIVFVRSTLRSGEQPTVNKFFNWLKDVKDPNYKFLMEIVFTYLLALNIFRVGVRRNNSNAILAGRQKFSPLFYIQGMTKYQEITHRDITDRSNYPNQLKDYIQKTESVSASGHSEKGEGGDFILENKNKRLKMWLPKGVPSEKQWVKVNRNLDSLDEVKEALQSQLGFSDTRDFNRTVSLKNEIHALRKVIRQREYLLHPEEERSHVSIDGIVLDHDLVNFSQLAAENKEKYYQAIASGREYGSVKLERVYITPEDRAKYTRIESKTKKEIESVIVDELLEKLYSIDQRLAEQYGEHFFSVVKKSNKQAYIDFYYDLQVATDETLALQVASQNDDNE